MPHLHRSFLAFVWMLLTLSTVILVFCDVKVSMKKCDVFDFISVQIRYVICVCSRNIFNQPAFLPVVGVMAFVGFIGSAG